MTPIDQINERIDIEKIAAHLGLLEEMKKSGGTYKGLCPFHTEKTPSFTIDTKRNTFHCFGCGEGSDPIDLYCKVTGLSTSDAIAPLNELLGIEDLGYKPLSGVKKKVVEKKEMPPEKYWNEGWRLDSCRRLYGSMASKLWAEARRWNCNTLNNLSLIGALAHGVHPNIGMPPNREDKNKEHLYFLFEYGIKCRPDLASSKSSYWVQGKAKHCAWRVEQCDRQECAAVVILEGETDCISLLDKFEEPRQYSYIAQPGASWVPVPELAYRIGNRRHVYLCGDCDQAGQDSNKRLAATFRKECDAVEVWSLDWGKLGVTEKGFGVDELLNSKHANSFWTSFQKEA